MYEGFTQAISHVDINNGAFLIYYIPLGLHEYHAEGKEFQYHAH